MTERRANVAAELSQWGLWRRKLIDGAALSGETVISRSMAGRLRTGANERRPNGMTEAERYIDIDRKVMALPENLQRVIIAEYVAGGNVREKTATASVPASTYYRHLDRALLMISH